MTRKRWSEEDLQFVEDNYKSYADGLWIAERLGTTPSAVRNKAYQVCPECISRRVPRKQAAKKWQPHEVKFVAENYKSVADAFWVAERLGATPAAVKYKARQLGINARNRDIWSREEMELLESWAETRPFLDLLRRWNTRAKSKGWPRRNAGSLSHALKKIGASQKALIGWYKCPAIAEGLEISQRVVIGWCKSGKLKAQRLNGDENSMSDFIIREKDFVNFVLKYPGTATERITPNGACWLLQVIAQAKEETTICRGNAA